jgi:universal stress protein A
MSTYQNILVAIDLSNESSKVIKRAKKLAGGDCGKLQLVHVVEPIAAAYPIDAYAINISKMQEEAMQIAKERLADISKEHEISAEQQHIVLGSAGTEIRTMAKEIGADLIVIGSHGRSGWKLLLGSTANKVLHGSECDILTVHVGD